MKNSWKVILLVFGLALWTTGCGSGSGSSSNASANGVFGTNGQTAPVAGNLQQGISVLQQEGINFIMVQTSAGLAPTIDLNYFSQHYPGIGVASSAIQYFLQMAIPYAQQLQYSGQSNSTTYIYTETEILLCQALLTGQYG